MKKLLTAFLLAIMALNVHAIDFIDSDELFEAIDSENFDKPIVVEFWADWCMPSRLVAPRFESNAYDFQNQAYFFKCDINDNPEVVEYFNLKCLPCVLAIFVGINDSGERQVFWTGAQGEPYLKTGHIKSIIEEALDGHTVSEQ